MQQQLLPPISFEGNNDIFLNEDLEEEEFEEWN